MEKNDKTEESKTKFVISSSFWLISETYVVRGMNDVIDHLDTSFLKKNYKDGKNSC